VLLSHYSNPTLAPFQRNIAAEIERIIPGPSQQHLVVHVGRRANRIDDALPHPAGCAGTGRGRALAGDGGLLACGPFET
jgi:hypothetical protein